MLLTRRDLKIISDFCYLKSDTGAEITISTGVPDLLELKSCWQSLVPCMSAGSIHSSTPSSPKGSSIYTGHT